VSCAFGWQPSQAVGADIRALQIWQVHRHIPSPVPAVKPALLPLS